MTESIQSNSVFYSESSQTILNVGDVFKKPTQVEKKEVSSDLFSSWGDDNLYPQSVVKKVGEVSLVGPILEWKARALYGGGMIYGIQEVDESGKETFKRIIDEEIENWMLATDLQEYLMRASIEFFYFYNIFPELITNKAGDKILYLTCKQATDCRWGKKEKGGYISKCFLNDWENSSSVESKDGIPVFSPFDDKFQKLLEGKNKGLRFIYPVFQPSPGRNYYQKAPWHVLFDTWYEIAKAIPLWKAALMKNQIFIKYIIHVPEHYWTRKYKDWANKSEKDQVAIIKNEHKEFNDFFTKVENQGKSIMVTELNEVNGKKYKDWKVEAVGDQIKEGTYIEDSQEADAHIFKNLNVDPTIFGSGPGKNTTSSGSGSDKRVAYNIYLTQQTPYQDLIVKPLQFISRFNGWEERLAPGPNKKLVFKFKNIYIATLDAGKETETK